MCCCYSNIFKVVWHFHLSGVSDKIRPQLTSVNISLYSFCTINVIICSQSVFWSGCRFRDELMEAPKSVKVVIYLCIRYRAVDISHTQRIMAGQTTVCLQTQGARRMNMAVYAMTTPPVHLKRLQPPDNLWMDIVYWPQMETQTQSRWLEWKFTVE